jgi:uncharacterized membrane protein
MNRNTRTLARIALTTAGTMTLIALPYRLHKLQRAALDAPQPAGFSLESVALADVSQSIGVAINDKGDVVGTAFDDSGETVRAFVVRGRRGELLPLPSGSPLSVGTGINDKGDVVGLAGSEETVRGVLWTGNKPGVLTSGKRNTAAVTLSAKGTAAGIAVDSQRSLCEDGARLWLAPEMSATTTEFRSVVRASFAPNLATQSDAGFSGVLWTKPGDGKSIGEFLPQGGSASGTLVGMAVVKSGQFVPAAYRNGKVGTLPVPDGQEIAIPIGANDKDTFVGAGIGDRSTKPVAWARGKAVTLPVPGGLQGIALGINGKDEAVGVIEAANGEAHAALWRDGSVVDLDEAVGGHDGWKLVQARGINDRGAIVGTGIKNGKVQAFVLKLSRG